MLYQLQTALLCCLLLRLVAPYHMSVHHSPSQYLHEYEKMHSTIPHISTQYEHTRTTLPHVSNSVVLRVTQSSERTKQCLHAYEAAARYILTWSASVLARTSSDCSFCNIKKKIQKKKAQR